MLKELHDHKTVEDAAQMSAGNWRNWLCFVWFGKDDYRDSDKIMLGYLFGLPSTIIDRANAEFVKAKMAPYIGMFADQDSKHADDYGASFHGDKNLLTGLMVRVYDNGQITEAFRTLYELAKQWSEDIPLDAETYARVNRVATMQYVGGELPYLCEKHGWTYHHDLIVSVTEAALERYDYDEINYDEVLESLAAVLDVPVPEDGLCC